MHIQTQALFWFSCIGSRNDTQWVSWQRLNASDSVLTQTLKQSLSNTLTLFFLVLWKHCCFPEEILQNKFYLSAFYCFITDCITDSCCTANRLLHTSVSLTRKIIVRLWRYFCQFPHLLFQCPSTEISLYCFSLLLSHFLSLIYQNKWKLLIHTR